MRDTAFKWVLKTMEPGTEVTLDAPYGSFMLHNNASVPAVFLTGGIGVTPVEVLFFKLFTIMFRTESWSFIPIESRKMRPFWMI